MTEQNQGDELRNRGTVHISPQMACLRMVMMNRPHCFFSSNFKTKKRISYKL